MKYLLVGDQGQLGKEFTRQFKQYGMNYLGVDIEQLNIAEREAVSNIFEMEKPEIVINCAAYNDVDGAERNPDAAIPANIEGPRNLAAAAKKYNSLLVHYSSDYVFSGDNGEVLYTEDDATDPINAYGRSKLMGEKMITGECDDFLVFRLSWVYGMGNQNFIYKLKQWANNKSELNISSDEFSVPTSTKVIVDITLKALEKNLRGLYHLTNSGYASRFEWAQKIIEWYGMNVVLHSVERSFFDLPAPRPYFSAMSNKKLSTELGVIIPEWEDSLNEFLRTVI